MIVTVDVDGRADYRERLVHRDVVLDESGRPAYLNSQLWGTPEGLPVVGSGVDPEEVTLPWFPEPGGVRFRFFTFQPMSNGEESAATHVSSGDESAEPSNFLDAYDSARPGKHISDSVDFVHVLSGEVVLELERREVLLRPGDVVIMRGTWHKWRNEGTQPCTVSSVMVGAKRHTSDDQSH
ncbi:cupin domain [Kribbella sp. VKM Ac-2527]|uniref:Cupin domain n=1 Tax=Kribbella caucasensis TaxID=2512215 RepID=A0A4R6KK91_9ACTN|nr:cupin domain-containing protein [Kribbella sp. VKM Ac-2527]TDO51573.1 cupin domain [Kribbella sp. VKM Ac-2527]